jgi:solute carrier family 25 (mitochondrial phosphate transporter), member 3
MNCFVGMFRCAGQQTLWTNRNDCSDAFLGGEKNLDAPLLTYIADLFVSPLLCFLPSPLKFEFSASFEFADFVVTSVNLYSQYNRGLIGGFNQIIAEEGAMALTTGLGATAAGYFVQGWFKFGGVEFFKINIAQRMGEEKAWDNKTSIYLASAACAEFIADIFLCPLEAVRIRSVSDPEFCTGLVDGFQKMAATEGIGGFYAGFLPILAKQIPYTCAKFVVQGSVADNIYAGMGKTPAESSNGTNIGISLLSGVIAGVASAIISHPADTLLSKVNKKGAGGDGAMMTRLMNIAKEIGFVKLCTVGLAPRCVMIGTLTAGQFGIFDTVMNALGASKFHFHNPNAEH